VWANFAPCPTMRSADAAVFGFAAVFAFMLSILRHPRGMHKYCRSYCTPARPCTLRSKRFQKGHFRVLLPIRTCYVNQ
jgi:hypothetical protein